jgi:hypothetical protein
VKFPNQDIRGQRTKRYYNLWVKYS